MLATPLFLLALFVLGFAAWSFLEYVIHGWLSHTFATPAAPLHWTHHRDPRRVFTSLLVWGPTSVAIWSLLALLAGPTPAAALVLGILAGFQRYEYVHWRIHFRAPRGARQELLRVHHLAHHFRNPEGLPRRHHAALGSPVRYAAGAASRGLCTRRASRAARRREQLRQPLAAARALSRGHEPSA